MKIIHFKSISVLLFSIILFSSCTVQKRRYSSGFHVDWHFNKASRSSLKTNLVVTPQKVKVEKISSLPIPKVINCQLTVGIIEIKSPNFISQKPVTAPSPNLRVLEDEPKQKYFKQIERVKTPGIKKNELSPGESKSSFPKGVLSTVFALLTWVFIFFGIVLAFSVSGGLLGLIFLGIALATLIASLSLGIAAMASPKDTADLVFGIIGTFISVLTITVIIVSVFL